MSAAAAASCGTDEFDGAALDDARWDVLRPAAEGLAVAGGKLNLTLRNGDLISGTANAENVVLQEAPAGGWTATTKLNVAAINAPGEQAGSCSGATRASARTRSVTARDGNGSGIGTTELHFGDGNWRPYTGPIRFAATLRLRMSGTDGPASDTEKLTLRG